MGQRIRLLFVLAALAAPAALADSASAQAGGVKVYSANVENVLEHHEDCPGDWRELVAWIATHSMPDVILLQQVEGSKGRGGAGTFVNRLNELTPGRPFRFVVAEESPDGTGKCGGEKRRQTNAIVYNTDTMAGPVRVNRWRSLHEGPDADKECEPNSQSRTVNLKAQFAPPGGPVTTAASIHWPTAASGGKPCDDDNARLTDRELKEAPYASSSGQVVGGDLNATAEKLWYRQMQEVGFTDAMAGDPTWTHILDEGAGAKRRIDYLFARFGTSQPAFFKNPYTLTFAMAERAQRENPTGPGSGQSDPPGCHTYKKAPEKGCAYSEHRAVVARAFAL